MSDIRERALLVKVSTAKFGTQRKDQAATRQTADDQNAEKASVSVTKSLIPKNNPQLKALVRQMSAVSNLFRFMTGPWDENFRIISAKKYGKLREALDAHLMTVEELKDDLRQALPTILADAPRHLGNMYDENQYPDIDTIIDAFRITIDTEVIPDRSKHILVGLDDDRVEKLISDANSKDNQRAKELHTHTHGVVSDALTNMISSLENFGDGIENSNRTKTFRDTLVSNMADVADVLKGLNISNDPALDKLADDIIDNLTSASAPILRGDKIKGDNRTAEMIEKDAADLRKEISGKAKEIADDLDGVFGIAS